MILKFKKIYDLDIKMQLKELENIVLKLIRVIDNYNE